MLRSHGLDQGSGAEPGFFLGGGAPLRNDVTDGEVKNCKCEYVQCIYKEESFISRGGGGGWVGGAHPPLRSASEVQIAPYNSTTSFICSFWLLTS